MFNLMRKDFLVLKKTKALYMLLALAIFSGIMLQSVTYYFLWGMVMSVYFYVVYTGAYDNKYDSEKIFNSLPIDKGNIVLSKYLSAVACLLIAIAVSFATTIIIKLLTGSAIILNIAQIGTTLLLTGVYLSVYFPIYFKVGYMNSRWANIAGLIFMFSFSSIISNNSPEVQSFFAKYLGFFVNAIGGNSGVDKGIVIVAVALVMLIASTLISLRIYSNKEFS